MPMGVLGVLGEREALRASPHPSERTKGLGASRGHAGLGFVS